MRLPKFVGSSDASQSTAANGERTINWRIELLPKGSKNQAALYPTEGQSSFVTVTDIATRALFTMNARTLGVIGTGVYGVDPVARSATKYGTVVQDGNPAVITMNGVTGNQAGFASGGNFYSLDLTTNILSTVISGDVTQVGMLDGYGVVFQKALGRIRLTDLNDFTTADPTQFSGRSAAPDTWQAMLINPPDLWLIGSLSADVWYDSGDFPFPFAPRRGVNFKYGTSATFSVAMAGTTPLWLSANADGAGIVVQAQGYNVQPVSTPAVEARIAEYQRTSIISDAEAWGYQKNGHTYYVLRFPTAQACEVYDLTTGQWHERGTWISAQNRYDCWHPRCHTHANGLHLVGDASTGQISILDEAYGTEADGSAIRRVRITPSLYSEDRRIPLRRLEIYLERGLGTSTGQGSNPVLAVECSTDGGKTYGRERQGGAGRTGDYNKRMVFTRWGTARDRVFRVTASDPIPWRLIDAHVNNDDVAVRA